MGTSSPAPFEQIGSSSMVDRVVQHIDKMIGKGLLNPGQSISEPALIAELGIGRVPVREAIRILAGEGLLELVPNRSARLRAIDATEILEMLDVLACFSVSAIHALSARPVPEDLAIALLASSKEVSRLAKMGARTQDMMREVSRFHYMLIEGSKNRYMLRLLDKTRMHYYTKYLIALLGRRAFLDAAPGYGKIAAAVIRGDSQMAIRTLLKNIDRSKSHAKIDEPL